MDKVFFYDLGIRNVLIDNLKSLTIAMMLENYGKISC